MPLFHPRIIKKIIAQQQSPIPESHLQILTDWKKSIESEAIYKEKETSLHGHFSQQILVNILGYQAYQSDAVYSLKTECPIGRGRVDVALGRFKGDEIHVVAPFELKGAKTKNLDLIPSGRIKSPVQQAWEYAMDAVGAQWVLVSNYVELRLYAVGYGRYHYESWQFTELTEPDEYARFVGLLSAENLLGDYTRLQLEKSQQVEKDITNKLYLDYKQLRLQLIADLQAENTDLNELDAINYAQTILDRILFVAFGKDRGLLPDKILKRTYETQNPFVNTSIWDNFKGLFQSIDAGNDKLKIPAYNGSLFKPHKVLDNLILSDAVCLCFKELGDYDFNTEVNVTVLGHIFEQSISDLEELRAEAQDDKLIVGKRKREGVVYTPDAITHFIVEQTLGRYVQDGFQQLWEQAEKQRYKSGDKQGQWREGKKEEAFWRKYQDWLKTVKVVDPACGSGAFLVAAFDFLYQQYEQISLKLEELTGQDDIFDSNKEILKHNLYGVDVNHESIEITKLSLWLKTAKYGKKLLSLNDNLKVGDSLIEDSNIAYRAFLWKKAFSKVFKQGGFDVVLGNPPYVRMEFLKDIKPYLQRQYEVAADRADLYAYFFERGLRLLKPQGKLGFICSSTFFKTGSGENLRRYLLNHAQLQSIVDFGDLQIFEGVTTYPAILVMQKQQAEPDYQFPFLVLKQLPEQELSKEFEQKHALMSQSQLT
ncbi:MAG: N-6 DNA methylase, partial [Thiotrichaceae bacterium]|nr:N-6 DNA methylase [Thiotrichaceae bacterium]